MFLRLPKISVRSSEDLKHKFIFLKILGMLDHIKQKNDESLGDFYTRFSKDMVEIDQVITAGKTICTFV